MTGTITALRAVVGGRERTGLELARAQSLLARSGARSEARRGLDAGVRLLPTAPVVGDLLPGGALRGGSAYAVEGSTALMMAMLAGPSSDGEWCGMVGVPAFGAAAARELGVDLDRLVVVPEPGRDWLNVVAALVDALTVVVVRPPGQVTSAEAARLGGRLRRHGAVLVALGSWPGAEARLTVGEDRWHGLDLGHGYLTAREATVTVTGRGTATRPRRHRLWLPDRDGSIRLATPHLRSEPAPLIRSEPAPLIRREPDIRSEPAWRQEAVG